MARYRCCRTDYCGVVPWVGIAVSGGSGVAVLGSATVLVGSAVGVLAGVGAVVDVALGDGGTAVAVARGVGLGRHAAFSTAIRCPLT